MPNLSDSSQTSSSKKDRIRAAHFIGFCFRLNSRLLSLLFPTLTSIYFCLASHLFTKKCLSVLAPHSPLTASLQRAVYAFLVRCAVFMGISCVCVFFDISYRTPLSERHRFIFCFLSYLFSFASLSLFSFSSRLCCVFACMFYEAFTLLWLSVGLTMNKIECYAYAKTCNATSSLRSTLMFGN